MIRQRRVHGLRDSGLQKGRCNAIAAQLLQVIHGHRVAVRVDESGEENVALAIDVLGALGISPDDGSVNDDRAGWKNALAIEDPDVVKSDLSGACPSVVSSCVVRCDCVCRIKRRKTRVGVVMRAGSSGF